MSQLCQIGSEVSYFQIGFNVSYFQLGLNDPNEDQPDANALVTLLKDYESTLAAFKIVEEHGPKAINRYRATVEG